MSSPEKDDARSWRDSPRLTLLGSVLGVALVTTYIIALFIQWFSVGQDELPWARRIQLLGGLEALAFAAAGAILGTTVQRRETRKAEARAVEEKARADANEADAETGRVALSYAKTKAAPATNGGEVERRGLGDQADPAAAAYRELVAFIETYEAARRHESA